MFRHYHVILRQLVINTLPSYTSISNTAAANYLLTPRSRVLLEKLTGLQLVKKFPLFYGTRRFLTAFTSVPILSQLDPVHTPTFHFLKIHFNIILSSTPRSPQRTLSLRFPHQNPVYASLLPHTRYMPSSIHSSRFYHPKNIGWVQNIKLFIM
jgi:hypothetical protein